MIYYFIYYYNGYSGAATQAINLAKSIKQEVVLVKIGADENLFKKNRENILIEIHVKNRIGYTKALIYLLFKKNKILHFHGFFKAPLYIFSFLKSKIILKTTLNGDDDFFTLSEKNFLFKRVLKNIYLNIVLSEQSKEINKNFIPVDKIKRIPNTVFYDNMKLTKKNYIYVGDFSKRKGLDKILNFIAKNKKNLKEELNIIAPIPEKDKLNYTFYLDVLDIIKKHKLKANILGKIPHPETIEKISGSKALFLFSENEGLPNSVLEAMSQNTIPIINTLNGLAYEITPKGALIIDNYDNYIEDEIINKLIRSNIYINFFRDNFSRNGVINDYNKIYEALYK